MTGIGMWIVILTLSTMVADRRYKSGYRGNAQWRGWRLYLICFGAGIAFLGWLIESGAKRQSQARLTESPKPEATQRAAKLEPAPAAPRRAALAGIELGSEMQILVRQGATCYEDEEAEEPGAVSCEMQAYFGGMKGPLNAHLKDGRVTVVFANDNLPEQIAALRSELLSAHGSPTPVEGGERWTLEGDVVDLKPFSVVLYRPQ